MKLILPLLTLICFSAAGQTEWKKFSVGPGVEISLPGTPDWVENKNVDYWRIAILDTHDPQARFTLWRDSISHNEYVSKVSNDEQLHELYTSFINAAKKTDSAYVLLNSEFQRQKDITYMTAQYESYDEQPYYCDCQLVFLKNKMHVIQSCSREVTEDVVSLRKKARSSLSISSNYTHADQLPDRTSAAADAGVALAVVCVVLFFLWAILYIVLIVTTNRKGAGPVLTKGFSVARWTCVVLFGLIFLLFVFVTGQDLIKGNAPGNFNAGLGLAFGVLAVVVALVRPPSPGKAVL